MEDVKCTECGAIYSEDFRKCPKCGSTHKTMHLQIKADIGVSSAITGMRGKKPKHPGKRKERWKWISEDRVQRGDGKTPIHYEQFIDRDNDIYEEKVIHRETGEIIHECKESLKEHIGHSKQEKQNGAGQGLTSPRS